MANLEEETSLKKKGPVVHQSVVVLNLKDQKLIDTTCDSTWRSMTMLQVLVNTVISSVPKLGNVSAWSLRIFLTESES